MKAKHSSADAWAVLREFGRETEAALGDRLVCVSAFGSLVNGDYVPGFSDLDQVVVVRSGPKWKRDAAVVQAVVSRMNRRQPNRYLRLHEGYVVRRRLIWTRDLDRDEGLVPRDVRNLILHGRTIAGQSIWSEVKGPTDEELREAAIYSVYWLPMKPPSLHALLNCIFAVAGARYRIATGGSTWTKKELVGSYRGKSGLPDQDLVAEAGALRRAGDLPPARAPAAFRRLLPRYQGFLTGTRSWLTETGQNRLRRMRTRTPGVVCTGQR